MKEEIIKSQFPSGFKPVSRYSGKYRSGFHPKPPAMTIAKNGYIIFNVPASARLTTGDKKAISIAFFTSKRQIAFKPERTHIKPPLTYKLTTSGLYKRHVSVAFKTLARIWNIALDGKHYLLRWNEKSGVMIANLNDPY